MTRNVLRISTLALTVMTAGGCATGSKDRLATIESANRQLTQRINQARSELAGVTQDRDELNRRLLGIVGDVESLQAQLAARPTIDETAAGWTPVPGGAMIAIESRVLFAPGKVILRPEAQRTLDGIVSTLQGEYGEKDILVIGHTDDRPIKKSGWDDNWQLSSERALAVLRSLAKQGVARERMIAGGSGEHRPLLPNSSEPNRTANRRVEIFALDRELSPGRN